MVNNPKINIVGAGLAGVEAAFAIANRGFDVNLFEMKPYTFSEVHRSEKLAEIVCSNSFGNKKLSTASGVLKKEMEILGSTLLKAAYEVKVEAGGALAVDRVKFSDLVTSWIEEHPRIHLIREKVEKLNDSDIWVVACGPLCDKSLLEFLQEKYIRGDMLYFFDAIAPIVYADTVDYSKGFWGSRYSDDKDYFNCVLTEEDYKLFYKELINAQKVEFREFEKNYFEACLPIEEIAERGEQTLLFGPLKPVGLKYEGKQPFAVVQLRKENKEGTLLSMVGFQTKLTYPEQKRVFRLIPALRNAEFAKLGSLHRNTFIDSPHLLNEFLQLKSGENIFFAGQITGVEGYMASAVSGIYVGMNIALKIKKGKMLTPPKNTMFGGLIYYITIKEDQFQPISENFGFINVGNVRPKKKKREIQAELAIKNTRIWREQYESEFN
ncbi:methylenetetrahydrofolate--tRNA-(uracil(54)-C(5))-methyltransferase (FADH(2)-oxidizing) TrmFO [Hippea maritima]|uniref:Methylenetetrahydrofolate--tRNA-(uracil-5-)-methyltransferase TrmFO n=1 Tax=Hippea maritima (strain ATCC 700847 / DSM 10411 / MH2) TaxID=760142 RepID=F2LVJ6_HIPMA|nr:methylenetetrahydrofolate--tRNA-(uracil(54)-C(5))-methyltransferase (FADH(2)-oxidizing) TrmFO [Hippea maritima]AEA33780.1 Methylenetetrahydrofolate--tRNA-(uracil-5-)-methyltransferase trmFO [Hippea maritima DSM 10411]